eukprot:752062-Hanusia_phi.AAC.1
MVRPPPTPTFQSVFTFTSLEQEILPQSTHLLGPQPDTPTHSWRKEPRSPGRTGSICNDRGNGPGVILPHKSDRYARPGPPAGWTQRGRGTLRATARPADSAAASVAAVLGERRADRLREPAAGEACGSHSGTFNLARSVLTESRRFARVRLADGAPALYVVPLLPPGPRRRRGCGARRVGRRPGPGGPAAGPTAA